MREIDFKNVVSQLVEVKSDNFPISDDMEPAWKAIVIDVLSALDELGCINFQDRGGMMVFITNREKLLDQLGDKCAFKECFA